MDTDGGLKRPVMIHRALFGSIERFFGILIEHFAGKFPLWISPRQICILSIADRHVSYAERVKEQFQQAGFVCDLDDSAESMNKKVRNAQLMQYNYILTVGDKEMASDTVSVRTRDNVLHGDMTLSNLLEILLEERKTKSIDCLLRDCR